MNKPAAQFTDQERLAYVRKLFIEARREHFEDGMHSVFSRSLDAFMLLHGVAGIEAIRPLVWDPQQYAEVISEALRWIGNLENKATRDVRRLLLEDALRHDSPMVRDGAGIGLASIDDPLSIPALEAAIKAEPVHMLQLDLQQVLDQLIQTALDNGQITA